MFFILVGRVYLILVNASKRGEGLLSIVMSPVCGVVLGKDLEPVVMFLLRRSFSFLRVFIFVFSCCLSLEDEVSNYMP